MLRMILGRTIFKYMAKYNLGEYKNLVVLSAASQSLTAVLYIIFKIKSISWENENKNIYVSLNINKPSIHFWKFLPKGF